MYRADMSPDPFDEFAAWLNAATQSESFDVNSFSLATASKDGKPSVRVLLFKGLREVDGKKCFSFFTNENSAKGRDLAQNPQAEMMFYWPKIYRQVRISGQVRILPKSETETYFLTRSYSSQIGAWASKQSEVVASRDEIRARVAKYEEKYPQDSVPCPDYWHGYGLIPDHIEFWFGRDHRLHDRFRYVITSDDDWEQQRLAP